MTGNNHILDCVNINAYIKIGKNSVHFFKILSGNEILTSIKGHNSDINVPKMMRNNPKMHLVNRNAYVRVPTLSLK